MIPTVGKSPTGYQDQKMRTLDRGNGRMQGSYTGIVTSAVHAQLEAKWNICREGVDCSGPPVAAASGDSGPPKNKDPCAGLQRGYDQEKSILANIDAQREAWAKQYNKSLPKLSALQTDFNKLGPAAESTVNKIKLSALEAAAASLIADIAIDIIAPEEVEGQPAALFDAIKTVNELREWLNVGTLEQLQEWALSAPSLVDVTPVVNLVAVGERMQDLANTMIGLKNQYDGMQGKRDAEAQKVADAKHALDDCLAGG
jgi:hypothetical protein